MTYIGIRLRESRPQEPKGSQSQKKRRQEERESSVDWKLIVEISLLLSFFSFGQKRQRKEGGGGTKHKCLRVLAGFSASTQKQNGSVNKKRSLMLVSDTRPQASQAWKQRRHSSASLGLLWGHVSHSETSHPEMYSPDKGRMESVRLFIWRGH